MAKLFVMSTYPSWCLPSCFLKAEFHLYIKASLWWMMDKANDTRSIKLEQWKGKVEIKNICVL